MEKESEGKRTHSSGNVTLGGIPLGVYNPIDIVRHLQSILIILEDNLKLGDYLSEEKTLGQ